MTISGSLNSILVLMFVGATGIIGMLFTESAWDWVLLALASLPLVVGGWCAWVRRQATVATRR